MKQILLVFCCLLICIFSTYAITYDTYENNIQQYNRFINTEINTQYQGNFNSTTFNSTSSSFHHIYHNTVKPLNNDGSISGEYTTYGNVYYTKYNNRGLDIEDEDEPNASLVPIGDCNIYLIISLFICYLFMKTKKSKCYY